MLHSIFLVLISAQYCLSAGLSFTHHADVGPSVCASMLMDLVRFTDSQDTGFCDVGNQPALGSMATCLIDNFNSTSFIELFLRGCSQQHLTHPQMIASYENATTSMISSSNLTSKGGRVYQPVKFSSAQVKAQYIQTDLPLREENYSIFFGTALVSYWFVIMAVAGISHWSQYLFPGLIKSLHGPIINWFRKHFILAPTGRKHHSQPKSFLQVFHCMVPLRYETLILLGWFILALVFVIVNLNALPGFAAGALANRCAVLATFSLSPLILFAGRNNFLLYVSGWPYSRFMLLHRWVARVVFALLLIHGVGQTINLKNQGIFDSVKEGQLFRYGVLGLVAAGLMLFQALKYFRNQHYEIFLLVHIALGAVFIAGGWRHMSQAYIDIPQFHYAAVIIWIFDRLMRLVRLAFFGVQTATVELRGDETLRVTVNRPRWWKPSPGSHAFIHFMKPTHFWQSHPFSFVNSLIEDRTITFYIKVKGGITQNIYRELMTCPGKKKTYKVLVEGPYTTPIPVHKFDNAIFVAGGNGIPGVFNECLDLARKNYSDNRTVKLYWVIREFKALEWFTEELGVLENTLVQTIVYVTAPPKTEMNPTEKKDMGTIEAIPNFLDGENSSLTEGDSIIQQLGHVEFRVGRPNLDELIHKEAEEASGSVAFVTCGHPGMIDAVRLSIMDVLDKEQTKRIEYFETNQIW